MHPLTQFIKNITFKGLEKYGRYYSSYRGFVINNEDPESFNRLQLKVPNVYGNDIMTEWAWPKTFSGPQYGCQNIPEKKEMVWVEFEQGDVRRPIWNYGHFGKPGGKHDIPEALRNIKNRWFKTPGGHLIEFDDNDDEIRLTHSDGKGTMVLKKNKKFVFNGGDNGALINIDDLVNRLNDFETALNSHLLIFNLHTHSVPQTPTGSTVSVVPSSLDTDNFLVPLTINQDLEDTNIKH